MRSILFAIPLSYLFWMSPDRCFSGPVQFLRADSNGDSWMDISDPVFTLFVLFTGSGIESSCDDAVDSNDDGAIDISDAVFTLDFLFTGGPSPREPSAGLGCDPTPDGLTCGSYGQDVPCPAGGALIIDHNFTDLTGIPTDLVEEAKGKFKLWYGHTSHGSQILSGMDAMRDATFDFNDGPGTLSIDETCCDLGNPDFTEWAAQTRQHLSETDSHNVVMWSWCGQASWATEENIANDYLANMDALEKEFPSVKFIYMTGHLDGSGLEGNLNRRNEQIRDFCRANGKILFDFAGIESYDPDGNYYLDRGANDNCDYDGGNWALEWCQGNPGKCSTCDCAHSQSLNCDRKARAFWWMMAKMNEISPAGGGGP